MSKQKKTRMVPRCRGVRAACGSARPSKGLPTRKHQPFKRCIVDAFDPVNEQQIREAAELIWQHWSQGTALEALPPASRPATPADGQAIQRALPAVSGQSVVGWKIAATSVAGQQHIRVSGPLAGRLLSRQVGASGATMSLRGNRMRVAEPEFAFRMAWDLRPRKQAYQWPEVLSALGSLHPAIEVPDSRFVDFAAAGEAQLLADNACAGRFVLGAPASVEWRALDLSTHRVSARCTGSGGPGVQREGVGANVLGDPRRALVWLVNDLSGRGEGLRAGDVVTTGTCMQPLDVAVGDAVVADFGALGRVSVSFVD